MLVIGLDPDAAIMTRVQRHPVPIMQCNAMSPWQHDIMAVYYTHLDVDKGQDQYQPPPTVPIGSHLSVTSNARSSKVFKHIQPSCFRPIPLSAFVYLCPQDLSRHTVFILPFQMTYCSFYKSYNILMLQYLICFLVISYSPFITFF